MTRSRCSPIASGPLTPCTWRSRTWLIARSRSRHRWLRTCDSCSRCCESCLNWNEPTTWWCRSLRGPTTFSAPTCRSAAADSWYQRDRSAAAALEERDDEMDDLHTSLIAELASGSMALPVTMEMTLVARFYERLGDHAVNIARRVIYLAGSHNLG